METLKYWAKKVLFPGLDLHTRCRTRFLPKFFRPGPIHTLDAGCGNGSLSYAAYQLGNHVLGICFDPQQTQKNSDFFSKQTTENQRLQFQTANLYDLPKLGRTFDQIICSETLEHITQDKLILEHFYRALRPGGILHLCCPYALHPEHHLGRTDGPEDGGHVRDGYTLQSYRALLEPIGFEIVKNVGLGSPLLCKIDRFIRGIRNKAGDLFALPFFLATWPLQWLDKPIQDTPFSLYIQAIKK